MLSAFNEVSAQGSHLKLELRSQLGKKGVFHVRKYEYCARARSNEEFTSRGDPKGFSSLFYSILSGCDHSPILIVKLSRLKITNQSSVPYE